eukprot:UN15383
MIQRSKWESKIEKQLRRQLRINWLNTMFLQSSRSSNNLIVS